MRALKFTVFLSVVSVVPSDHAFRVASIVLYPLSTGSFNVNLQNLFIIVPKNTASTKFYAPAIAQ